MQAFYGSERDLWAAREVVALCCFLVSGIPEPVLSHVFQSVIDPTIYFLPSERTKVCQWQPSLFSSFGRQSVTGLKNMNTDCGFEQYPEQRIQYGFPQFCFAWTYSTKRPSVFLGDSRSLVGSFALVVVDVRCLHIS